VTATLLVVGDVHDQWRDEDRQFVERAGHDLTLFVGDLGDENVGLVGRIASIRTPKAVLLGNHDAWQSFSRRAPTTALLDSLSHLGADHLGYSLRELPEAGITIVGARPFSWGGPSLRSPELYEKLYAVRDVQESAQRIVAAARRARHHDLLILAHNGPTGLSVHARDIWGKDFGRSPGGDWGDRDLELAIEQIQREGRRVRAVVAGHMHDRLTHPRGRLRERFVQRADVWYANAAVVPRVRTRDGRAAAHYLRLVLEDGRVASYGEIWVGDDGAELGAE
jgi:uncharacterized protein (TIGR04168 family)